jgi:hypothetical protein
MPRFMNQPLRLGLEILRQPDNVTCGPTCLHAVYRYYGEDLSLNEVIRTTPTLPGDPPGAGTLARWHAGGHARLRRPDCLFSAGVCKIDSAEAFIHPSAMPSTAHHQPLSHADRTSSPLTTR